MVESARGVHPALSRWTRQAIHCQADDEACKMCSTSCTTVEDSRLPECCEAYNACCDQYFQACKRCSSIVAKDQYFPEYCCASFTDCCDLITTFETPVKPPEPVRKEPKLELKVPTVAAPKPTTFPGSDSPAAPISPLAPQLPSQSAPQSPPSRLSSSQASPPVVVGRQRTQTSTRTQQRSRPATRPASPQSSNGRRGRITSRGRVIQ
ncbi:hypothetical protein O3P69_002455 [Scylla paramamosain]|uniref:SMB domain-containing protein n=2 Tax=Scylla paramamosain TaxID=85552 RepID=A0AAW0ULS7_SCYPA